MRADPELDYFDQELFEVENRDGLYYEKPNWVDKYLRRDLSEWNELSLPQYIKMFDATSICKEDKEEDQEIDQMDMGADCETNDGSENVAQKSKFESDKVKYKTEVKFHYLITRTGKIGKPLPNIMKLQNPCPGEPKFLRKRRHPKALRFYKVKRDINPQRFFLS